MNLITYAVNKTKTIVEWIYDEIKFSKTDYCFVEYNGKSYRQSVNVNKFGLCAKDGKFSLETKRFQSVIKFIYFIIVKNLKHLSTFDSFHIFGRCILMVKVVYVCT